MVRLLDTFTAARILRLMRTMLTLWVVCWGMGAGVSHAQDCTNRQVVVNKNMKPNIQFSVNNISGAKVLDTFSSTLTFTGCSGFANTPVTWQLRLDPVFEVTTPGAYQLNGNIFEGTMWASCFRAGQCFDTNNAEVRVSTSNTNGIALKNRTTITGTQTNGANCLTIKSLNSGFAGTASLFEIDTLLNGCSTVVYKVDFSVTQETVFAPSNATTLKFNFLPAVFPFGVLSGPGQMGSSAYTLFTTGANLVSASGTCALSLSNSNLDMGMISPEVITRTYGAVVSKPLTITVNNCTGYASGKKKVMQWVFTTPHSSDLTRMENAIISGGSSGISAQIVADSKYDLSGNLMANRFITSGENYITRGGPDDNQTLNYRVYLIRNTDAVKAGAFSSTATVTLSYQ